MKECVSIDELHYNEFDHVEFLTYLYNANLSILKFLLSQETIDRDNVEYYTKQAENRHIEMAVNSEALAKIYLPESMVNKPYRFNYIFDEYKIEFISGACNE